VCLDQPKRNSLISHYVQAKRFASAVSGSSAYPVASGYFSIMPFPAAAENSIFAAACHAAEPS